MASTLTQYDTGHWVWDEIERGITFVSHNNIPNEALQGISRTVTSKTVPGCLYRHLDLTFEDAIDVLDQMRFKRHIQRHVQPGKPDVVTIRDIKDVVLFLVQQPLPQEFLLFFYSSAVDRFLRALILYCDYYIQIWERLTYRVLGKKNKIREPGLRNSQKTQQENLNTLRALLAREYINLLLGVGSVSRFHHMAFGGQSWTQRDARLWELLLRLSVRVTWIALQRRHLNLIDVEIGRLFRGVAFNTAARKHISQGKAPRFQKGRGRELREEVLNSVPSSLPLALYTQSPVALEILSRGHEWSLLGLGRLPLKRLQRNNVLENALYLPEEEFSSHGLTIGILGMQRTNLDTMLNIIDKQRRQETLYSAAGIAPTSTYTELFPAKEDQEKAPGPKVSFPKCISAQNSYKFQ